MTGMDATGRIGVFLVDDQMLVRTGFGTCSTARESGNPSPPAQTI